jgi:putative ABC transport system substrate-binding protein
MIGSSDTGVRPFVEALRALGHVEGKTIAIEWKRDEGRGERLPALAAELVAAKVALVYAVGPEARAAARGATATIPIVMLAGTDPVSEGFAQSLERPGGNVTGLVATYPELAARQLELLKELVPGLARVGALWDAGAFGAASAADNQRFVGPLRERARALGLELRFMEVRTPGDVEGALAAASSAGLQAVRVGETTMLSRLRGSIAADAIRRKLPVIGQVPQSAEGGYLAAYGVSLSALHRRAAGYADRILRGAAPGTLPIEKPSKLELVLNLRTARALGLTVPPAVLARADRRLE